MNDLIDRLQMGVRLILTLYFVIIMHINANRKLNDVLCIYQF